MSQPSVSVALCTYNGARYLGVQLRSLAEQTWLPHELVVSDDGSTDDTADIVAEFARAAPFPVHFLRQPTNLGVVQNFAAAITACRGDLIALCDQDDFWLPYKLRLAAEFLVAHPQHPAVFSDAVVVDDALRPLPKPSLWEHVLLTESFRPQIADPAFSLEALAGHFFVTGATLVIRRELARRALPIPRDLPKNIIHDGWIALVASVSGGLGSLEQPTMLYRQHAQQQVGLQETLLQSPVSFRAWRETFRALASELERLHALLHARSDPTAGNPSLLEFARRAAHFRLRAQLPAAHLARIGPIAREAWRGGYHRYCHRPLLSMLRDFAV